MTLPTSPRKSRVCAGVATYVRTDPSRKRTSTRVPSTAATRPLWMGVRAGAELGRGEGRVFQLTVTLPCASVAAKSKPQKTRHHCAMF